MSGKKCTGLFAELDGEQVYKIENYDAMDDFFMTIISASDIWNFCWSQGGITAGRINCDKAIFPYYTADKVSDAKSYTGPYTLIAVNKDSRRILWEPFATLSAAACCAENENRTFERNIYKNFNGSKVWFEEINLKLSLTFRYCWTSSEQYGIVRKITLINNADAPVEVEILDGARNFRRAVQLIFRIPIACCLTLIKRQNLKLTQILHYLQFHRLLLIKQNRMSRCMQIHAGSLVKKKFCLIQNHRNFLRSTSRLKHLKQQKAAALHASYCASLI